MAPPFAGKQVFIPPCVLDDKLLMKYGLYYRRTNVILRTAQPGIASMQRYLIEFTGVADSSLSLEDVYHLFFSKNRYQRQQSNINNDNLNSRITDTIVQGGSSIAPQENRGPVQLVYSKMFQFFVCLYQLHNHWVRHKKKSGDQFQHLEYVFGYSRFPLQYKRENKESMKKILLSCREKVNNFMQSQEGIDPIDKISLCFEHLQHAFVVSDQSREQLPGFLLKSLESDGKLRLEYLNSIMNSLYQLHFMRKEYKELRLEQFYRDYKDYLTAAAVQLKAKPADRPYHLQNKEKPIAIRRYAPNRKDEVLINIMHLIQSKEGALNRDITFQLSQQLIKELNSHKKITNRSYPLLSPRNILLNQLTLSINLDYENILRETLGLLGKPLTVQSKICFNSTPQSFDQFASPIEFNASNYFKMTNLVYGYERELVNKIDDRMLAEKKQEQQKEKLRLMRESETWRCLMSIAFLMKGEHYHTAQGAEIVSQPMYQQFVSQQAKLIEQDQNRFLYILGQQFKQLAKRRPFQQKFTFSSGIDHLYHLIQDDNQFELVTGLQFTKLHRIVEARNSLMRSLMRLIERQKVLNGVYNPVKYLVRFYIAIFNEFRNFLIVSRYLKIDIAKGVLLVRSLSRQTNLSEQKQKKIFYVEQALTKFKEYESRDNQKNKEKLKYVTKNYPRQFQKMQQLYDSLSEARRKLQEINDEVKNWQNSTRLQTALTLKGIQEQAARVEMDIVEVKNVARRLFIQQFVKLKQLQEQTLSNQYLRAKIKVMLDAIFKVSGQNLYHLQAMIIPIVAEGEGEKAVPQTIEDIDVLQYLQDLLNEQEDCLSY